MMLSRFLLLFIIFQLTEITVASKYTSSQSENDAKTELGVWINDFIILSSQENSKLEKVFEIKIFWKFLDGNVADGIRQDCGVKLLIPYLLIPLDSNEVFKAKSVNCSFTKEFALINVVLPITFKLLYYNGKFISLTIKPVKEDQEVCTLVLRGYENFRTIIAAYVFDKDKLSENEQFVLVKLPQGFDRLINTSGGNTFFNNGFVIFNPNEGKGKRFRDTKKCIETLIKNKPVEDIRDNCIVECDDFDEDLGPLPLEQKRTEL